MLGMMTQCPHSQRIQVLTVWCAPLPSQQGHVDGWQVISLFSVYVCTPDSYVDHLSYFSSVPPRLCVHYLDVIPVKVVASFKVVGAQSRFFIAFCNRRSVFSHSGTQLAI